MKWLREFMFEIVGESNKKLAAFWVGALVLVLVLGLFLSYQPVSMLGVAESREFNLSFENPVELKKIYVSVNQEVSRGDLLAELDQTSLKDNLRILQNRLKRLETEIKVKNKILELSNISPDELHWIP